MEKEHLAVALVALLHDIGKFWQRTGQPPPGYEGFTEEDYGPHGAHAKWSAAFVSKYIPSGWRKGLSPVLYHHKPQDYPSKLIALADWLSAGERVEAERRGPSLLRSVFDRLRLHDPDGKLIPAPEEKFYYPLASLSLEGDGEGWKLNPHSGDGAATPEEYATLWQKFISEVEKLNDLGLSFPNYLETLYHLLKKYTWCIPSAYYGAVPDVSLFDHSRITAAIAVCLHKDKVEESELEGLLEALRTGDEEALKAPRFLLVGGDVSGVQDFIYTITSSGAAKGLRGRSFYLQLLNDAVARFLLRKLDLPFLNIIYIGGGNFYFLAPFFAREKLEELKREVSKRLLAVHKGDIYLALDAVEVLDFIIEEGRKDKPSRWAEKVNELFSRLNRAKERRFAELGPEMHEKVFTPRGEGGPPEEEGKPKFCQVCQEEDGVREDPDGVRRCELCRSFKELGGKIAFAEWLVLGEVEPEEPGEGPWDYERALRLFGVVARLVDRVEKAEIQGAERIVAYQLHKSKFLDDLESKVDRAYGFDFQAKAVPKLKGEIADFGDIAQASEGMKRLGVLRMDVDNLGRLFGEGLGWRASASRLATMSFMLSAFFKGWLGEICWEFNKSDEGERKGFVYLTYSGGDDLFLVCSWNLAPVLARRIRKEFAKFTCENKNVTISAGIAVVPEKYPVYKAAELAKIALDEEAKEVRRRRDGYIGVKDAISFLGKPLGWEEFEKARELKGLLMKLIEEEKLPRGLLARLFTIYSLYARSERARVEELRRCELELDDYRKRILYDKWCWRLVYNLARFKEAHKEQREQLEGLRNMLLEGGDGMIGLLDLAVRWTEFLTREVARR